SENAIANLPGANGVTNRFDCACELHTQDVLRITRRRAIMSATLQNVGAIQSSRMHSYAHAICSRRRRSVHLLHTDSLNSAMRCDDDCTHQSGCSSRAWIQTSGAEPVVPAAGVSVE